MDRKAGSYRGSESAARPVAAPASVAPAAGTRPFGPSGLFLSLVAIVLMALLVCAIAAAIALLILTARLGGEGRVEFLQDLRFDVPLKIRFDAAGVGVFYAGIALATILAALWRGGAAWTRLVALGGGRRAGWRSLGLVVATLAYAALATLALQRLRAHRVIIDGPTDYALVAMILANLVLLAPLAEELVFRGWLYTGLRARFGFWPSFLVTAIAFAAIHWTRILVVLPLAVALGLLRESTGSIRPTLLLHGCYNLVIVALTLVDTG